MFCLVVCCLFFEISNVHQGHERVDTFSNSLVNRENVKTPGKNCAAVVHGTTGNALLCTATHGRKCIDFEGGGKQEDRENITMRNSVLG
jgi:hypothetical protein